jgi:hypothetical protein
MDDDSKCDTASAIRICICTHKTHTHTHMQDMLTSGMVCNEEVMDDDSMCDDDDGDTVGVREDERCTSDGDVGRGMLHMYVCIYVCMHACMYVCISD